MKPAELDFLSCPICAQPLLGQGSSFLCPNRHLFDRAKEGYLHLLPVSKMHSSHPGDDAEMVKSRRRFHENDYYRSLRLALTEKVTGSSLLIDCGCGEGYYTASFARVCNRVLGIDLSKEAIRLASKADKESFYLVAGSFSLPVKDACADVVTNIFTPVADKEIARVLKENGKMLVVMPGKRHLWGLKEFLYETPYENAEQVREYPDFDLSSVTRVEDGITVKSSESIMALFSMTPYAHKTAPDAVERLIGLDSLSTEISFLICEYRKKQASRAQSPEKIG